ncbi:MAG: TIM barrel protein [Acidobacteria bacterium]|nr:TIM barrel protein [Acidobacteriota bacterium]
MNRRNFLQTTAAGGALTRLSPAVAAASALTPGFHLGCVTYNLFPNADLDTVILMLQTAGFEGVELRTTNKHGVEPSLDAPSRAAVRKKFEASKVRLYSYGTTCEFHSPDPAIRQKQVEIGKQFVDLAVDTGAAGIKVRPNGFPKELTREQTIGNISAALRQLGDYAGGKKIGVWLEIHGRGTNDPAVCAAIMKATNHPAVGLCWNSNDEEVENGSVRHNFELVRPWIRHVHINELSKTVYPYRELFSLLREANYQGFTLCECQESKEPERFLRWYKAMWTELNRNCA